GTREDSRVGRRAALKRTLAPADPRSHERPATAGTAERADGRAPHVARLPEPGRAPYRAPVRVLLEEVQGRRRRAGRRLHDRRREALDLRDVLLGFPGPFRLARREDGGVDSRVVPRRARRRSRARTVNVRRPELRTGCHAVTSEPAEFIFLLTANS